MIKEILQIIAAASLLAISLFLLFRYVKPRRNRADFIIDLLNILSEGQEEKGASHVYGFA